jgi:membrane-associated phospholipid phosphatase
LRGRYILGYIKYIIRKAMRDTIAKLITNILNPFLVSVTVIVLLAFHSTIDTGNAIKWAVISLVVSVLPVLVMVVFLVRRKKLDGIFANPRQQRTIVYVVASGSGALGYGLLRSLEAPSVLVATFAAGLGAIVIFLVINIFWKISIHTAFTAGAVTILVIVYGNDAAWSVLLLPPVGWSRMALKQHSIVQVAAGAVLAAGIVLIVFWRYGIIC